MNPSELASYRSHKVVRAGRILGILPSVTAALNLDVETATGDRASAQASASMCARFQDGGRSLEVGDYYVVYDDGYTSLSPKEAFDGGYGRLGA